MFKNLNLRIYLIISFALLLAACSSQRVMMPTPNEAVGADTIAYENIHEDFKSTRVPLFYVTDRVPEKDENGNLEYGYQRSASLAFGSTVVDLGEDISWEQLLEASRTQKRLKEIPLTRGELHEITRGPDAPIPSFIRGRRGIPACSAIPMTGNRVNIAFFISAS